MKFTDEKMREVVRKLKYPMSLSPLLPTEIKQVYKREPTYQEVFKDIEEGKLKLVWDDHPIPHLELTKQKGSAQCAEKEE